MTQSIFFLSAHCLLSTSFPLHESVFSSDTFEFAFTMEALVNDQVFNPSDPLIDEQADLWTDR